MLPARNAGVCEGDTHGQYYGLGSETRRTATWVPDPYGVEGGDPAAPPEWCDLYNVTVDEYGRRIAEGYAGGLLCCHDQTRGKVEEGFINVDGEARKMFFRLSTTSRNAARRTLPKNDCVHVQVAKQVVPRGGDLIFGVAHQHAAGIGASLHGQDGRLLCESTLTYGDGEEAGNEAGYVVGISACYPKQGTVKVRDGEVVTSVSNYSSERRHTGVMGLFYLLVADHKEEEQQCKDRNILR
ncbi:hypothetical protein BAE44_0002713 [Dichanthelium oligosanthes]|uniref:Uncharacterized protein n=1 Tax=Dichanthelium oligosanthes TaxID=888268 RepID=A0A1E5WG07_9POAL|nr:hypothetical protein BAE44_0002713 [Dichanthelium oligosanthes]